MAKKSNVRLKLKQNPWILDTMIRDNFQCKKCGCPYVKELLVHHIDGSRKSGKMNNAVANLITLCKPCHAKEHGFNKPQKDISAMKQMRALGRTYAEISTVFGISRQRVHFLLKRGY